MMLKLVCLFFVLHAIAVLGARDEDKITNLPGLTFTPNFEQYAGYIEVDPSDSRHYFYWFVESQNDPANDPIFLWLQGGPGCSSLFGFLTENGPFIVGEDAKSLYPNPYSWNKVANMLFLESPAGVGFSYSDDPNYTTGDNKTREDNYNFLQGWFKEFPEFSSDKHDFYISGESYGGHYVPQLAYTILKQGGINLKGFIAGNAYTDAVIETNAVPPFIYQHALCSYDTWLDVEKYCDLSPDLSKPSRLTVEIGSDYSPRRVTSEDGQCNSALSDMFEQVGDKINQYDVYYPCLEGKGLDCSNYTKETDYLNRKDVQEAIHANTNLPAWSVCSDHLNYDSSWPSVVPIYPELIDNYRVMIYSGDVTFNVPFEGSQVWIHSLNRTVVSPWKNWFDANQQVGGYIVKYDKINFVTVRDAGHMVPTYQPSRALTMFINYINGKF